ncbi:hypothetical protein NW762_006150 [Fusarium torreyae]|uniref:Peroxin 11C n=1 Tax=Fusarium torreyae TaxID=1237075 RepID=A0A9W8VEW0_9HYPO|nr:hypothetical protein NW762_006150 [Fusarium torreyae]
MTEVDIEPPISSALPERIAPRGVHNLESKSTSSTYNPLSRGLLPVSKLDGSVSHLHRLIHTRDGHDSVILFLAYTTQFAVSVLETPKPQVLQALTTKFGVLVQKTFLPNKLLIPSVPKLGSLLSTIPAHELHLVERLRALSSMLNDWHTMTRLWGLVTMWMLTKGFITSSNHPTQDKAEQTKSRQTQSVEKAIKVTQIMSLTWFFIFDNSNFLTMRGLFKWSKESQSKLMAWCARCWCIYVLAEMGRLLHERVRRLRNGDKKDDESRSTWKKKFIQTSAWLLLCVDYMAPSTLLPGTVAAFLATCAEYITVKGLWDATAEAK